MATSQNVPTVTAPSLPKKPSARKAAAPATAISAADQPATQPKPSSTGVRPAAADNRKPAVSDRVVAITAPPNARTGIAATAICQKPPPAMIAGETAGTP